jgi:hypothetical protein
MVQEHPNKDKLKLSCGRIIEGDESKRMTFIKLHRKKCDVCGKKPLKDFTGKTTHVGSEFKKGHVMSLKEVLEHQQLTRSTLEKIIPKLSRS